ncbi:hypothetical protein PHJA_002887000 [Phtheirospermum japonicum]|uniref:Uncharacterized protein n=1 Tax=Phtheirospermum japonicum TaxID=374723 RepID=A0A830DCJ6_9LAMI|nr:hypothetical protein PHJA_002887000 [Phtheirospermum japonicum]
MEFEEFAAEVFAEAVDSGARMEVLKRVPLGAAGIAGFGAVFRPGKEVVVAAIGAYAAWCGDLHLSQPGWLINFFN